MHEVIEMATGWKIINPSGDVVVEYRFSDDYDRAYRVAEALDNGVDIKSALEMT